MRFKKMRRVALAATAVLASGCATAPGEPKNSLANQINKTFANEDPCSNNARNIGIASGLFVGLLVGNSLGDGKAGARVAGSLVGGLVGGLIGFDMDRRRCEISKVAKAHNLDIVMRDITFSTPDTPATASAAGATTPPGTATVANKPAPAGMSVSIIDHGMQFAISSANPTADADRAFGDVADQYHVQAAAKEEKAVLEARTRNKQMRILLIGHTDDTGSSALNADLSEARAKAIAQIFAKHGFAKDQLFYQGAGEVFPIDTNTTDEGRARNRRVEIVDLSDDTAFAAFLAARRPNVAHYRPATEVKTQPKMVSDAPVAVSKAPTAKKTAIGSTPAKSNVAAAARVSADAKASTVTTTASAKTTAKTALSSKPVAPRLSALANLDLGGHLANGQFRSADIGKTERASSFSIISPAYAANESPVGSCATDRPRISHSVKSLASGQALKTSEYLPGTANASWSGKANGHLVGLQGVAVLRDGGQPASRPEFMIWKDFVDGAGARPDMKVSPDVNAYQGDKALLYRIFLTEGPVRCIDLVIPKSAASTAPSSNIVYEHNSALYQADFSPTIAR
ncbi:MAG: OmpA family protein [Polaromonas sp.]|nr:OmpA family protein [Polaromonas sp.]